MNPYQPSSPTDEPVADSAAVDLRDPLVTRIFAFLPMLLTIRASLVLTVVYVPGWFDDFPGKLFTSGALPWIVSGFASTLFAVFFLAALRRSLTKHPDSVDKVYDIFGVVLMLLCCVFLAIPPLVFGWH